MKSARRTTLSSSTVRPRLSLIVLAWLIIAAPASGSKELTIKNAAVSRTISWFAGPLRTTKIEVSGTQILDGPGVEFLIDIDYKGEPLTLSPGDFTIRGVDTVKVGQESEVVIELSCLKEGLPLRVYLKYHSAPGTQYLQKSLKITPCKEAAGAMLRRVTLEYCRFRREFLPVVQIEPAEKQIPCSALGDGDDKPAVLSSQAAILSEAKELGLGLRSDFGVIDTKSNKAVFFFVRSASGEESYDLRRGLVMTDSASVPLEQGIETGRATIGAVTGPMKELYKQFRRFLWRTFPPYTVCEHPCIGGIRRIAEPNEQLGAYLKRFFTFRNRFEQYFEACQGVSGSSDEKHIFVEGHIVDNKGFIILYNASQEPQKVLVPLEQAVLKLQGKLKLSDWTQLDSAADLGVAEPGEKLEVEIAPLSAKIVGVNIEYR